MMFEGKVAVVTGGSRGIGRAICREFAENGAGIAFLCRSLGEKALETERELKTFGVPAKAYACDVSDAAQVEAVFRQILLDFGTVDFLINNAGITRDQLVMCMAVEDYTKVIDTNLNSAFYAIRAVYPVLARKRSGRIVSISSVSGIHGNAGQANYSAAKAGLIGLSKTVARELAARNVTSNVIAPGYVATEMTEKFQENADLKKSIPMKRFAQPEEIAHLAVFLCSEKAAYITGQTIEINGGLFM